MLFCVFGALPLANRIFEKLDYDQLQRVFEVGAALSTAVWSLSTALALIIHIMTVKCSSSSKQLKQYEPENNYGAIINQV